MNLFYLPDLQPDEEIAFFSDEERMHAIRVLRIKEGEKVLITNGKGWLFEAIIQLINVKKTEARITSKTYAPRSRDFYLHLAVAPTKNINRYEWFLEKACEIGVDEITPLITAHSERQKINHERLERILIAAMKQSQTATLPRLNAPCNIAAFLSQKRDGQKFAGYCGAQTKGELFDLIREKEPVTILIGPEGDFSDEEIVLLEQNGYLLISMGTQRLRTETAGVAACLTANLKNRKI